MRSKPLQFTVVGCGDAFGSAGRLQTTYLVESARRTFLIDCGATAQIGLNRLQFDANKIDTVLISHLHGDHYAGLIWMMLSAQLMSKRKTTLRVVGPPSISERYRIAAEALFPGMTTTKRAFEIEFVEVAVGKPYADADLMVEAFEVMHPSGAPSHALRIAVDSRIIAFSGDTEWVEALIPVAAGADLFVTECCAVERQAKFHLNWRTIERNLPQITAMRIMLTHMNPDMLAFAPSIASDRILIAEDGLIIAL